MLSFLHATDENLRLQEAVEDERLLERARETRAKEQYSCKEDNESTPWLRHTGWPVLLANRPLDILVASTLPPAARVDEDYYLGHWAGSALMSSRANEAKLRLILHGIDEMFNRAEKTLTCTAYRLRCWLQTYHQRHFRPVAFKQLGTKSSRMGYLSLWKQFICYVFRVWATPKGLRNDIYSVVFQPAETQQMEYIWSTLLANIESESAFPQDSEPDVECEDDADCVEETDYNSEVSWDIDSEEDFEDKFQDREEKLNNDSYEDWELTLLEEDRR